MCIGEHGLLNWLINILPFELHLPGYKYCGPGTKLIERLKRKDRGANKLDEYCKEHDIAYQNSSSLSDRNKADIILMKRSRKRMAAQDASFSEKLAANIVNKTMLAKVKIGAGINKSTKSIKKQQDAGRGLKKHLTHIIACAKRQVQKMKPRCKKVAIKMAIAAAKELTDDTSVKLPRIISVPKTGGVLPLIPIFAGLSAVGALAGGVSGIAKAIHDFEAAKKQLSELKRHNEKMEGLCIGKGLQVKRYKSGYGISIKSKKN